MVERGPDKKSQPSGNEALEKILKKPVEERLDTIITQAYKMLQSLMGKREVDMDECAAMMAEVSQKWSRMLEHEIDITQTRTPGLQNAGLEEKDLAHMAARTSQYVVDLFKDVFEKGLATIPEGQIRPRWNQFENELVHALHKYVFPTVPVEVLLGKKSG